MQDIAPDGRLLLTRDEQRAGVMGMAEGAFEAALKGGAAQPVKTE